MKTSRTIGIAVAVSCMLAAVQHSDARLAVARLATVTRYAEQFDEYILRGDAAISESPAFQTGVRLAAWDGQDETEVSRLALAAAVYFFDVPAHARGLTVEIAYRQDDSAVNERFAGYVFVRNPGVQAEYRGDPPAEDTYLDEPTFYGNTYVLPAGDRRNVIELSAHDSVVDGVLELHVAADAGQVLDIHYVKVTAYAERPTVYRKTVVEVIDRPHLYTYRYYYAGPWRQYRSGTSISFHFTSGSTAVVVDPFVVGCWVTYRSSFYVWRPWVYRPVYVHAYPRIVVRRPVVRTVYVSPRVRKYRDRWYQQHFRLSPNQRTEVEVTRRVRERRTSLPTHDAGRFQQRIRQTAERAHSSGSRPATSPRRSDGYHRDRVRYNTENRAPSAPRQYSPGATTAPRRDRSGTPTSTASERDRERDTRERTASDRGTARSETRRASQDWRTADSRPPAPRRTESPTDVQPTAPRRDSREARPAAPVETRQAPSRPAAPSSRRPRIPEPARIRQAVTERATAPSPRHDAPSRPAVVQPRPAQPSRERPRPPAPATVSPARVERGSVSRAAPSANASPSPTRTEQRQAPTRSHPLIERSRSAVRSLRDAASRDGDDRTEGPLPRRRP